MCVMEWVNSAASFVEKRCYCDSCLSLISGPREFFNRSRFLALRREWISQVELLYWVVGGMPSVGR
jgi:hypothetical protein